MRITYFAFLFVAACLFVSCGNSGGDKVVASAFDSAYPKMYTDLGLPEYRRGTLRNVSGKDEGVKTVHEFTVLSEDSPSFLREFIAPNMEKLGWRDLKTKRRISEIHEDDLFFTTYVKGKNKFEVNSSATPEGSKTRFTLSVFASN